MLDEPREEKFTPSAAKGHDKSPLISEPAKLDSAAKSVATECSERSESQNEGTGWEEALASLEMDLNGPSQAGGGRALEGMNQATTSSDVQSRFRYFSQKREEHWHEYARWGEERSEPLEDVLRFYGSWSLAEPSSTQAIWPRNELNTEGFYFRWNGFGVAVNPSAGFLEQFHKMGHFIGDLNAVICTRSDQNLHETLERIYALNAQCNRISERKHRIDYYLCVETHKELFHRLEPRYKQERGSLHRLDKYIDSEGGECMTLHRGISLSYFYPPNCEHAGLLFELKLPDRESDQEIGLEDKTSQKEHRFKFAYLPFEFSQHTPPDQVVGSALIVFSLRPSLPSNAAQLVHDDTLELDALAKFLGHCRAKMVLLSEFASNLGDLRLEISKHLKTRLGENGDNELLPILPADGALQLEMATWRVQCAVTRSWIPAPFIHVVRQKGDFGPLLFVGSDCVL